MRNLKICVPTHKPTNFNKYAKQTPQWDCQRVAFPVLLSRGGYGCYV